MRADQHLRQHRQPAERMGVEQGAGDLGAVDAGGEQPLGQCVRAGPNPAERTGVGDQTRVQAVRDFGDRSPRPSASSSRASGRVVDSARFVDQIESPKPGVGAVVVDHQCRCRPGQSVGQRTEAARAAAVDGDQQVHLGAAPRAGGTTRTARRAACASTPAARRARRTTPTPGCRAGAAPARARARCRWCRRRAARGRMVTERRRRRPPAAAHAHPCRHGPRPADSTRPTRRPRGH